MLQITERSLKSCLNRAGAAAILLALSASCQSHSPEKQPGNRTPQSESGNAFDRRFRLYSRIPFSPLAPEAEREMRDALKRHWKRDRIAVPPQADREICGAVKRYWKQKHIDYVVFYLRVKEDWAILECVPETIANARDEKAMLAAADSLETGYSVIRSLLRLVDGKWQVVKSWPADDLASASEFKSGAGAGVPSSLVEDYVGMQRALEKSWSDGIGSPVP